MTDIVVACRVTQERPGDPELSMEPVDHTIINLIIFVPPSTCSCRVVWTVTPALHRP